MVFQCLSVPLAPFYLLPLFLCPRARVGEWVSGWVGEWVVGWVGVCVRVYS